MNSKWKVAINILTKLFLTGKVVKKKKCDRCGADMPKMRLDKNFEYLCSKCTKDDLKVKGYEILEPKINEALENVNEKIDETLESKAEEVIEKLEKATEVVEKLEKIKDTAEAIKDIIK